MRWQNAQLNTSLARAQAVGEQALAEARKAEQALADQGRDAEHLGRPVGGRDRPPAQELAGARQRLEIATSARAASRGPARASCRRRCRAPRPRAARLDEQLAALREPARRRPRTSATRRSAGSPELPTEAERLRTALGSPPDRGRARSRGAGSELEQEVGAAARGGQLGRRRRAPEPARGRGADQGAERRAGRHRAGGGRRAGSGARPARRAAPDEGIRAARSARPHGAGAGRGARGAEPEAPPRPGRARRPPPPRTPRGRYRSRADQVGARRRGAVPSEALTRLTADLPLEMRLQVQGLLVDLDAKLGQRGVTLTVPGAACSRSTATRIEPTAHDTLAKVAELIDAYQDHAVVIVGHTDSIGEAATTGCSRSGAPSWSSSSSSTTSRSTATACRPKVGARTQPIATNDTVERAPGQPAGRGPDPGLSGARQRRPAQRVQAGPLAVRARLARAQPAAACGRALLLLNRIADNYLPLVNLILFDLNYICKRQINLDRYLYKDL